MNRKINECIKPNIALCGKKIWLDKNLPHNSEVSFDLEGDYANSSVRNFAYESFAESTRIRSDLPEIMAAETKRVMKSFFDSVRNVNSEKTTSAARLILTDAVFTFNEITVCIDRLLCRADGLIEICEIKAATHVKDSFIKDLSFKYAVLSLMGYTVKRVYIRYINGAYVKQGKIDANKFFFYKDVTESAKVYSSDMLGIIKESLCMAEEPFCNIGYGCLSPHKCNYWGYCTGELPDDNVFNIAGLSMDRKFELYDSGIISFEDIEKNRSVSPRQMEQVSSVLHLSAPKINKKELVKFLDCLTFPLYFLDFETFQSAIPRFDGVSPFTQIPFQYSLHCMVEKNGEILHKEFLADYGKDPRRELAERLVKDIPDNVCVVAYNMVFEKNVIRKLALLFKDLYDPLMKIHDNIKDLMIPFQKHYYYDRKMNGSYSIKAVLPALFPDDPELDYKNLNLIHNGIEAMISYQQSENADNNTREEIRSSLLKYCGLDTYAMVKIWQKLNDVVN
ncbi:MAG: DUF2779 domain-containing protein [Clostridia bacterium]|nr:DUF2779 domain-containing protein [Clostridia bacterium]